MKTDALVQIQMPSKLWDSLIESLKEDEREKIIGIIVKREKRIQDKSYASKRVKEELKKLKEELKNQELSK